MNSYKKLVSNSMIFAIGNMGSKLVSFFLVPLYTYFLTTSEYGLIDLTLTSSSMLLPVISLSISESVLRFSLDKKEIRDNVLKTSVIFNSICIFFLLVFFLFYNLFFSINSLVKYVVILVILQSYQTILSQYTRGIGRTKQYALNGILMTLVMSIFSIVFLVKLNLGIKGYMYAIFLSNVVAIFYLSLVIDIKKILTKGMYRKILLRKMIKYSVPLIPNAFMWWSMTASSRYFILLYHGTEYNGLFAVANKIPSLITMFSTIFFQAWQLSAIEGFESDYEDKNEFQTKVYSFFIFIMILITFILLLIIKPIFYYIFESNYYIAWKYVPFLLTAVLFSSFSSFLGANYIASKETKGVFITSIIGGTINFILSIILIKYIGVIGAGISSTLSFLIMWRIREHDSKKYVDLNISKLFILKNLLILGIQIISIYSITSILALTIINVILFFIFILLNLRYLKSLKNVISSSYRKRINK